MNPQSITKPLLTLLASTVLLVDAQTALSQSNANPVPIDQAAASADNSKSNKMDPTNTSATADAQTNNANDVKITQSIRKSLISDKSLSTYAHNIKVVTVGGHVTLNGVVRSEEERASVEAKAASVVGQSRVANDLKVSPKS
jgi:hyperosmotically inducible periplasmic protein